MASAASAATAARRKSGEEITARRLHLADERPRRGRVEQNGLFGPRPQEPPPSGMSTAFEGLHNGSLVTPPPPVGSHRAGRRAPAQGWRKVYAPGSIHIFG